MEPKIEGISTRKSMNGWQRLFVSACCVWAVVSVCVSALWYYRYNKIPPEIFSGKLDFSEIEPYYPNIKRALSSPNPFDQFDTPPGQSSATVPNPFDQFDDDSPSRKQPNGASARDNTTPQTGLVIPLKGVPEKNSLIIVMPDKTGISVDRKISEHLTEAGLETAYHKFINVYHDRATRKATVQSLYILIGTFFIPLVIIYLLVNMTAWVVAGFKNSSERNH